MSDVGFRNLGIEGFRNLGIEEFRNLGIEEFRDFGIWNIDGFVNTHDPHVGRPHA